MSTSVMTPKEIVHELDKFIIGQNQAKKSVAIALRNRYRRSLVEEPLKSEIIPKNILMIGPTGVGKTEIARRLANLAKAPFIKVEATKFTEIGYVGRDVDSIIRDLTETAMKNLKAEKIEINRNIARGAAENRILDILVPLKNKSSAGFIGENEEEKESINDENHNKTRQIFRKKLIQGDLDEKEITIKISAKSGNSLSIMGPPGMEDFTNQLQGMFADLGKNKTKEKKMKIKDAMRILIDEEAAKLINEDELRLEVIDAVEQHGIVFIDEIDKVVSSGNTHGPDVSKQGVQRDLLPLVEGTTINTKYGMVKTDYILFITSGAFHLSKPSDLIPELQGRLPIRVELDSLSINDFKAILTNTDACLTKQYQALLGIDEVNLEFTEDGIQKIAELAFEINEKTENIGARRLHTIMEKLLEDLSFEAKKQKAIIDEKYVSKKLQDIARQEDLARYIL